MNAAKKGLGRGLSALFGDIEKNPKPKQTKQKSNLRVAIMLGIPLAQMNLKQNPSQLSPESVPHKGGKHW